MPMNADEFDTLCAQYLDGVLSEEERERLLQALKADPERLAALRVQLLVSGALSRLHPDRDDEIFVGSVVPHLASVGNEQEDAFSGKVMKTIRFKRMRLPALAIAAAVALVLALGYFFRPVGPEVQEVARVFSEEEGKEVASEVRIGEKLSFAAGVSRMEFTNGAVVAIEGPASLTVKSAKEVALEFGRLNAWCPESAHGFQVMTASATLTDLGTSFGIDAARDGTADFVVLDGKVEVKRGDEIRTLVEGGSVQAGHEGKLRDIAFEPSAFKRTWPVASGIRSTRGEVVPAPPGRPELLAGLENDDHILVIPERRDLRPGREIRADIIAHGDYYGAILHSASIFAPEQGSKVRSYLLRYNPVGTIPPPDFRRFEGSVTFDRPVRAIMTATRKLERTDKLFSKAPLPALGEQDAKLRGLERGQSRNASDRVTLSEDRLTVTVVFYAGESIDEIRVITDDGRQ